MVTRHPHYFGMTVFQISSLAAIGLLDVIVLIVGAMVVIGSQSSFTMPEVAQRLPTPLPQASHHIVQRSTPARLGRQRGVEPQGPHAAAEVGIARRGELGERPVERLEVRRVSEQPRLPR